jgi:hypothetical protein
MFVGIQHISINVIQATPKDPLEVPIDPLRLKVQRGF